ncbi:hypothetical protein [Burkholderia latens]|jgi:hypothetical protein|uniref:hypothetical protein n=1 Tax=Burkholderia latens TaxID=488446 RepID=UPI00158E783A|nr:hypothetical protein [Burkholderia latens]
MADDVRSCLGLRWIDDRTGFPYLAQSGRTLPDMEGRLPANGAGICRLIDAIQTKASDMATASDPK